MSKPKYSKVLIHGNFEIVHTGHLRLFSFAREIGKSLTVGLNIEGLEHQETERRLDQLKAITTIDELVVFSDLLDLITGLRPSVIVKGREHANEINVEEELLKSLGGKIIFSGGTEFVGDLNIEKKAILVSNSTKIRAKRYLERHNLDLDTLIQTIENFQKLKVLVIGDVIIDEYVECKVAGLSLESYVPIVRPLSSKKYLGGAGIVAAHCRSLGAETTLFSVLGDDEESKIVRKCCKEFGLKSHFIENRSHPTVLKQRYVQGNQVLFRVNRFLEETFARNVRNQLFEEFQSLVGGFDVVIFSDFSYGVLDSSDISRWTLEAKRKAKFVAADSQTSSQVGDLTKFIGVDFISPTELEARMEIRNQEGLIGLSLKLMEKIQSNLIFLKLGPDGLLVNGNDIKTDHVPSLNENPVDVAGAGDAMLATSSLALGSLKSPYEAAFLGSVASALQISRRGNIPIHGKDLQSLLPDLYL